MWPIGLFYLCNKYNSAFLLHLFVGVFPEPDKDPVIQIANMVIKQGEREPFIRNVFTLRSCAPVIGSQVISNEKESDLLKVSAKVVEFRHDDVYHEYK